jgi:hypothetical protein
MLPKDKPAGREGRDRYATKQDLLCNNPKLVARTVREGNPSLVYEDSSSHKVGCKILLFISMGSFIQYNNFFLRDCLRPQRPGHWRGIPRNQRT